MCVLRNLNIKVRNLILSSSFAILQKQFTNPKVNRVRHEFYYLKIVCVCDMIPAARFRLLFERTINLKMKCRFFLVTEGHLGVKSIKMLQRKNCISTIYYDITTPPFQRVVTDKTENAPKIHIQSGSQRSTLKYSFCIEDDIEPLFCRQDKHYVI